MKQLILSALILLSICQLTYGQWPVFPSAQQQEQPFQKIYPFFDNEAYGDLLFTQQDGYIISGVGKKDKFYLFLIKTDFAGDTIWTRDIDLGLTMLGSCYGTSDDEGNLYISIYKQLVKIDTDGNLVWTKSFGSFIENIRFSDNILWSSVKGTYLYKINPVTGDSLWRSNSFAGPDYTTTSLDVNSSGDVMMTVSHINGYTFQLHASELYLLNHTSDSVISIPFNSGVDIVILDTKYIDGAYYGIGRKQVLMGSNPGSYLIKYTSEGTVLNIHVLTFPYSVSGLDKMHFNNNELVFLGGAIETNQSSGKVLLHCRSLEGDSLWTTINGLESETIGWDFDVTGDGGYIISGSNFPGFYSVPCLLKTNSLGLITGLTPGHKIGDKVSIYPNPSSGVITLQTKDYLGGILTISSLTGQTMHETQITSEKTILSAENYPAGIYLYSLRKNNITNTGKVVIQ